MSNYDDNMKGVLFAEQERKSDKHPVMKGHCVIDGKKYWISVWGNVAKSGTKYWSMALEEAQAKFNGQQANQATQQFHQPQGRSNDTFDDDMPF